MWEIIQNVLDTQLFRIGSTQFSLGTFLYFLLLFLGLLVVTSRVKKWLVNKALLGTHLDRSARQAVGSIFHYSALLLGSLIIIQTAGIDLTTLNVVAGALGVGLGFGLQNVASNFISGVIILFERPIKLGDRIEVGNVEGDVVEIRARSTTVITNDNIAIIVPNSKFISENVTNWTYNDKRVRFGVKVGVAYGSDAQKVSTVLRDVAAENPDVLADPPPEVRFSEFGDSSLNFELLVWSATLTAKRRKLISDLNFAIYDALAANNITIPFPQRELHVIGGVDVRLSQNSGQGRQ